MILIRKILIAGVLLVPFLGIDMIAVSYPGFFGLTNQRIWAGIEEVDLG